MIAEAADPSLLGLISLTLAWIAREVIVPEVQKRRWSSSKRDRRRSNGGIDSLAASLREDLRDVFDRLDHLDKCFHAKLDDHIKTEEGRLVAIERAMVDLNLALSKLQIHLEYVRSDRGH